jgi:hypothetical protein
MIESNLSHREPLPVLSRIRRSECCARRPRRPALETLLLAAICVIAASFPIRAATKAEETAPVEAPSSKEFEFSYVVRVNPPLGSRHVRVWIPLPSTDTFQTISELKISSPAGVKIRKEHTYDDRYAYFEVDSKQVPAGFDIRLTFHVIRYERHPDLPSARALSGPPPKEVAQFLRAENLIPTDGAIATLSDQVTQGETDPVQRAHRIYDYVISTMRPGPLSEDGGRGDAVRALQTREGNCADFDSLFIALSRTAGIPARFEVGFLLPEEQKQGTVPGYRSWAEFYVNGFGWIPVDVWEGAQDAGKHADFFGFLTAQRVMISMGRDITLTPAPQVGRLNYIASPHVEADGQTVPVSSIDFFFNASGLESRPTIFRRLIFARGAFSDSRIAS